MRQLIWRVDWRSLQYYSKSLLQTYSLHASGGTRAFGLENEKKQTESASKVLHQHIKDPQQQVQEMERKYKMWEEIMACDYEQTVNSKMESSEHCDDDATPVSSYENIPEQAKDNKTKNKGICVKNPESIEGNHQVDAQSCCSHWDIHA